MTRARNHANGVRSPSLPQLWLTAMLRAFVELVLHLASTLQMTRRREAVIATQPTPADLPRAATDTHPKETNAAQQSSPPIALILRSAAKLRVSKDEGVLTTPLRLAWLTPSDPPPPHSVWWRQPAHRRDEGDLPPPIEDWGRWIARPCAQDGGGRAPHAAI